MQLQHCLPRLPRTTCAQREQWVQLFRNSGLPRRAFAREHGLKLSTLQRWLAKANGPAPATPKPMVFKEVPLPHVVNGSGQGWSLEILTPSGLLLRLR